VNREIQISIASGATFTPTLTAPIIDEINDNNGNEEIIFTTTTSAVNELTIANAATGNAPEIAATGDDTDIDLKLTPKGAGNLVLDGIEFPNADGSASQVSSNKWKWGFEFCYYPLTLIVML
jgi:hypothetical protein